MLPRRAPAGFLSRGYVVSLGLALRRRSSGSAASRSGSPGRSRSSPVRCRAQGSSCTSGPTAKTIRAAPSANPVRSELRAAAALGGQGCDQEPRELRPERQIEALSRRREGRDEHEPREPLRMGHRPRMARRAARRACPWFDHRRRRHPGLPSLAQGSSRARGAVPRSGASSTRSARGRRCPRAARGRRGTSAR